MLSKEEVIRGVPPLREHIEIKNLIKETGCNLTVGVDAKGHTYCFLEDCYISKGISISGEQGIGETVSEAIVDYMRILKNNILIVHPGSERYRREIFIM